MNSRLTQGGRPREPGEVEVAEVALRVPDSADPASALTTVSAIVRELPQFEELGGNSLLDGGAT